MLHGRALQPIWLAGAILLLQGCVAAAIPVLAGGAMVRGEAKDGQAGPSGNQVSVPTVVTPNPGPSALPSGQAPLFASFANYAIQQAFPTSGEEPRLSAMLENPGLLDGERRTCGDQPLGVLIDLDPEDALLPLDVAAAQPDHRDANLLESLRRQGVKIGWLSGRSAADAGDIRSWLQTTDLDQSGEDILLLMRYPDDRKQSRRAEFAREFCVIAIAGDRQTDFDELYEFLIDPAKAIALEALYGDGWFMIPPLTSQEQE